MGEGSNRRRGCQHLDCATCGPGLRPTPSGEAEGEASVGEQQLWRPPRIQDHRSDRKPVDVGRPQDSVRGPLEPPPRSEPLRGETLIQVLCTWRPNRAHCSADGLPIALIRVTPAQATRSVPRSKSHSVVEKEDRRPSTGSGQWRLPAPILGGAHDPKLAAMVTHHLTVVVDQTPSIPGEHAPLVHGMNITPGVDSIAAGHHQ